MKGKHVGNYENHNGNVRGKSENYKSVRKKFYQ